MRDWRDLPTDLLVYIYQYLPRRDRLACSLVCSRWKEALDHVRLWRKQVIYLDTDLIEPSTVTLIRDYSQYIKTLELGWAIPHRNVKWAPPKYKEFSKNVVRLLLVLHDNYIQVSTLRIFNWFDLVYFPKILYHFSRFLKIQCNLTKLTFDCINMQSANYVKLLTTCLNCRVTITSLDMRNCCYVDFAADSVYFRSCIEQLNLLQTLKLDYFVFSCKFVESILSSHNHILENLEIILKETTCHNQVVDDSHWCLLCHACPKLKVTLVIRNVHHYGELRLYLKQTIPVVSLSIVLPKILDKRGGSNIRKILNFLVNNYHKTLESMDLKVMNSNDPLDDISEMICRRCPKLKTLHFSGFVEHVKVLSSRFENMKSYCVIPSFRLSKTFNNASDANEMKYKRVEFTFNKRGAGDTCTLFILN